MIPVQPYRYLRICAWCGPLFLVGTILFWGVLGHNIPPYSGGLSAQQFSDAFRANAGSIRVGMIGMLIFTVLYLPWGVAISKVMEQVEHDNNVLSTLQIWGAGFTTVVFALASTTWLAATYRPDELSPGLLQFVYDLGWIQFDMAYTLTSLQLIALGVAFILDRRTKPLLPNWVAWFSIWVGVLFFGLSLMPFFKSGPFSRSGIVNYWVEFPSFFAFMVACSVFLIKAITRLEREHTDPANQPPVSEPANVTR